MRDYVNENVKIPMKDFAIPGEMITTRLQADHIVPFDKIVTLDGFDKLTLEQQKAVVNYKANFTPLSSTANKSKGSKTIEEWTMYKKKGIKINPEYRKLMMVQEKKLEKVLQKLIYNYMKGS
ncbi:hypothetical protein EQG49_04260 [Periweissella cryptocerci]|uniref:Uncharacterized protein n=1 Tax=Periweissella cryptocerci TaxID=2506420 RepID=A0A4P6YX59_9LACO|nr:hypothetical protein EQG49_04260 [Periweissella cryptocerci]